MSSPVDTALQAIQTNPGYSAAGLGVLTHLLFNRFEPRKPLVWALLLLFSPLSLTIFLCLNQPSSTFVTIILTTVTTPLIFLTSLLTSLSIYRLSPLHPLAHVPGPVLAKLSNFYMLRISLQGKKHIYLGELHARYGELVRIGPNSISLLSAPDFKSICSAQDGLLRSEFYRADTPASRAHNPGLISSLHFSAQKHAERRKVWSEGFTGPALREYDPIIFNRSDILLERLEEQKGSVDLGKWLSYFTFDFMGDLVFGGGFEMMNEGGDTHGLWGIIVDSMKLGTLTTYMPYMHEVLPYMPPGAMKTFLDFVDERIRIRTQRGSISKDLFYHIAREDSDDRPTHQELVGEIFVAILGGSDTTASVLASLFFAIINDQRVFSALRAEIDSTFGKDEEATDIAKLNAMPYLNAVINEALRVYPAIPTQIARTPGKGGRVISGVFVPEGTNVQLPVRPMQRDTRYWQPDADVFWPERWIESSEKKEGVVLDRDAFQPFGFGPAHCIGKHLAYREMRVVVARLVKKFDMRFAEGYDPAEWDAGLLDFSVVVKGRLPVVLTARE